MSRRMQQGIVKLARLSPPGDAGVSPNYASHRFSPEGRVVRRTIGLPMTESDLPPSAVGSIHVMLGGGL